VSNIPIPDLLPGTPGTLRVFSGIFFLYNFLVRDPGKRGTCAISARKFFIRHFRHIASIFRDLFSVHFSRKTFRKTGTMCRKCRRVKGEHLGIISRQTNRQVIAATGLAGAGVSGARRKSRWGAFGRAIERGNGLSCSGTRQKAIFPGSC